MPLGNAGLAPTSKVGTAHAPAAKRHMRRQR